MYVKENSILHRRNCSALTVKMDFLVGQKENKNEIFVAEYVLPKLTKPNIAKLSENYSYYF
jgi:hypothetical protein